MSDETDRCGHPTQGGDGPPCQHPATEGDSCWIDAHGGDVSVGRDFAIEEADHEAILEAARNGVSKRGCARVAGCDRASLDRYLDAHADFRAAFARARGQGERTLIADGLRDPETDSSMAKFLLSTSFGHVKTEKREVDMEADIKTTLESDGFELRFADDATPTPAPDTDE